MFQYGLELFASRDLYKQITFYVESDVRHLAQVSGWVLSLSLLINIMIIYCSSS